MNLNALSTPMMLNLTARWLENAAFIEVLERAGALGEGVRSQLDKAHGPLAELGSRRQAAAATLRALRDQAKALDDVHDRKARGLFYHLRGVIEGSDDAQLVHQARELEAQLFPHGLQVTRLPYIEEGGAAVSLDRAVGPEMRATLGSLHAGDETLLSLFEAWMTAGHQLGELVSRRAKVQVEIARARSSGALDSKAARRRWILAVRGLMWAIECDEVVAELAERVHALLEYAIASAKRRRAGEPEPDDDMLDDDDGEQAVDDDDDGDDGDDDGDDDDDIGASAGEPSHLRHPSKASKASQASDGAEITASARAGP